jgi:DNA-binding CsgD family transcriptional regulator
MTTSARRCSTERAALELVDTAYRMDASLDEWLRALLEAAKSALQPDLGVIGLAFQLEPKGRIRFTTPLVATDDTPSEIVSFISALSDTRTPLHVRASISDPAPLDSASASFRRFYGQDFADWPLVAPLRAVGAHDQVVAKAYDAAGTGCMFLGSMRRVTEPSASAMPIWNRILAHVLSALRLRNALAARAEPEAILAPEGRLLHATPPAQSHAALDALREAAVQMDRARTRAGRADAAKSLERWQALVAGRWSLIDSFETDGRRFLVARRNDPMCGEPRALSQRERQIAAYAARGYSNKHIAYVLGIAATTVSTHLRAAMRRLGVRSRSELAALFAPNRDR